MSAGRSKRVSIIIPAYNAERYIAEAIDSVLDQTWPDVECIVVDDGSTDRTADIIRRYRNGVKYFYQENAERSAARNRGFAESSGDFISFLDADDYIAPGKIEEQMTFMDAQPDYDVVYSRVLYFRDDGRRNFREIRRPLPTGDILNKLLFRNFISLGSPLLRRAVIERCGGFDTRLSYNEDWEFWMRLAVVGIRFGFFDACNLFCRVHEESSTSVDRLRMYESKLFVIEQFIRKFGANLRDKGVDIAPVLSFHHADYGRGLILHGRVVEGREEIAKACSTAFPYRRLFQAFSLIADMGGWRLLRFLQLMLRGEL
jgi:glycosyltransferase involved in cell wall biosynthesis